MSEENYDAVIERIKERTEQANDTPRGILIHAGYLGSVPDSPAPTHEEYEKATQPPGDKRYLVFEIYEYYPLGGMSDLHSSFNTLNEAIDFAKTLTAYDYQIYDRIEGRQVLID